MSDLAECWVKGKIESSEYGRSEQNRKLIDQFVESRKLEDGRQAREFLQLAGPWLYVAVFAGDVRKVKQARVQACAIIY